VKDMILAIETSTWWTGVAIAEGASVIASRQEETRNSHNEMLPGLVEEVISKVGISLSELELIGVSIGPGSFTALRIGLLYATGIAFAQSVKVVPVMSLDVLNASLDVEGDFRLPLIDAYKGEVFTALYEGENRIKEAVIADPLKLHEFTEHSDVHVFGPGCGKYTEEIRKSLGERAIMHSDVISPAPTALAKLTFTRREDARDPGTLTPFYLRKPDAKLPKK